MNKPESPIVVLKDLPMIDASKEHRRHHCMKARFGRYRKSPIKPLFKFFVILSRKGHIGKRTGKLQTILLEVPMLNRL